MAGTGVGKFSSTAGSNTGNLTVNFAENMAPSNVNNAARELMGHIRDMYEQLGDGYFEFGDGDGEYTVARSDADTITITSSADISSVYFAGRKIRITDGGANVVEGTIASSSHSSTTQTVNLTGISLASGTPTKVELGIDTAAFGGRVILDDDGDTYIEAPTDDTIDIYVAGAKDFVITANTFTAESGSTIAAQALTATTITTTGAIAIANDGNIGSAGDADAIAISSSGVVTFSQAPVFPDGSIAVADLDIDGATDIGAAIVDADLFIIDDGAGGTNRKVTASRLKTYAGASSAFTEAVTITVADNSDTLTLISTDDDASGGPVLDFYRNSSSPADSDSIGKITFRGRNDNSQDVDFGKLDFTITDASDGTEDAKFVFNLINAGTLEDVFSISPTETVFNDSSVDRQFRIESDGNANMFKVDGSGNNVLIGTGTDRLSAELQVSGVQHNTRVATFTHQGDPSSVSPFGIIIEYSGGAPDNNSDTASQAIKFFDTTTTRFLVAGDGDCLNHDNDFGAISDERIKDNIVDASTQWDDIKALKVRKFERKDDIAQHGQGNNVQIGVIAQELEAAGMSGLVKQSEPEEEHIKMSSEFGTLYEDGDTIPEGKKVGDIKTTTGENVRSVKYSVLYMKAIKALQEAMARIETLESKVTALES